MAVDDYEEITSDDERDIVLTKLQARLPCLTPVESFHDYGPASLRPWCSESSSEESAASANAERPPGWEAIEC
jgi:hypothetical protein